MTFLRRAMTFLQTAAYGILTLAFGYAGPDPLAVAVALNSGPDGALTLAFGHAGAAQRLRRKKGGRALLGPVPRHFLDTS